MQKDKKTITKIGAWSWKVGAALVLSVLSTGVWAMDGAAAKRLVHTPLMQLSTQEQYKVCGNYMLWRAEQAAWVGAMMQGALVGSNDDVLMVQKKQALVSQLMGRTQMPKEQLVRVLQAQMVEFAMVQEHLQKQGNVSTALIEQGKAVVDAELERLGAHARRQKYDQCGMIVSKLRRQAAVPQGKSSDALRDLWERYPAELTKKMQSQLQFLDSTLGFVAQERTVRAAFGFSVFEFEAMGYINVSMAAPPVQRMSKDTVLPSQMQNGAGAQGATGVGAPEQNGGAAAKKLGADTPPKPGQLVQTR